MAAMQLLSLLTQIMEYRPSSAVPPGQVDLILPEEGNVGLRPGILMPADHHARSVPPQQQQMLQQEKEISYNMYNI